MNSDAHREDCKEIFALLSDYLDLELPADTCQAIEKHLAGCPPCIEFIASLRRTVELCRSYRPAELPHQIRSQARDQLMLAYQATLAREK